MSNIIALPTHPQKPIPTAHYETVASYGETGPVAVSLLRRLDAPAGLIHVAVLGPLQGVEIIASLPDNDQGRGIAGLVGPAALRAVELSEIEFAAQPEAC
ncbi:hypothetical protein [Methylobacterium sp. NEAU K]|uniref:hypothetical protein n=1 Tax=Methylobacterium sp. NEAU K TaxID=3064946 RepID=UPI0027373044|nr:hypothetical protein [Methylobacterium sp. NEAU K]MDP4006523.1 hypothetical protein [Methylobacterium sp. NEAU K]